MQALNEDQDRNVARRRAARNAIVAAILAVIAADLVIAVNRVFPIRLISRSQCSLADTVALFAGATRTVREMKLLQDRSSVQKTEDGLDLWNTPSGSMWTVHGDRILPFLLFEQERDIYEPPRHEVRRGDIVLDCGANIGVFSKKALERGASLVVAIEPAPRTLDALRRNLEADIRAGRVIVYPKGVWDHEAELDLNIPVPENQGANSLVREGPAASKVRVPLTTIDRIVAELRLPRVDFIKMDIEGSEKQALAGGASTIKTFRPRMSISSEHLDDDYAAIPPVVKSIEPRYAFRSCDCVLDRGGVKAEVLAFDVVQ